MIDFRTINHLSDDEKVEWAEVASLDDAMAYSRILLRRVVVDVSRTHVVAATLGLFSGGNDSTTFMHLFQGEFTAAVHINTGIGIEATRQYVRDTCAGWNLELVEESPPRGSTYNELVVKYGFPGPASHNRMYRNLKERGLRQVRRGYVDNPRRERVIFVAGMRHFESHRRMRNTEETHREGSTVWVSPLSWWTDGHMAEYRERFDVPRNEVSDHLHMSGECLCGSFAKPGEIEQIRFFYPEDAARIEALQDRAREAGVHCVWGTRPLKETKSEVPKGYWACDCTMDDLLEAAYRAGENVYERNEDDGLDVRHDRSTCLTRRWVEFSDVGPLCDKCEAIFEDETPVAIG